MHDFGNLTSEMNNWAQSSTYALPSGAENQAAIQVRFILENCENNDDAYIDDELISGIS
jgi:hypothetical protein